MISFDHLIYYKWAHVFLIFLLYFLICQACIAIRSEYIFTVFHERIYHISTSSLINNITLYLYIIWNDIISVLVLIIVWLTKRTEKRWVTQFFWSCLIKSFINLNNILIMSWWSLSIISFVCKLYNKIIIYLIRYFIKSFLVFFLFFFSLSLINFQKYLCQHINFLYRNHATCFKWKNSKISASD